MRKTKVHQLYLPIYTYIRPMTKSHENRTPKTQRGHSGHADSSKNEVYCIKKTDFIWFDLRSTLYMYTHTYIYIYSRSRTAPAYGGYAIYFCCQSYQKTFYHRPRRRFGRTLEIIFVGPDNQQREQFWSYQSLSHYFWGPANQWWEFF